MMNNYLGPTTRDSKVFLPLVREFLRNIKDSLDQRKNSRDCGWWYGERALNGLLACAAARQPKYGWSLEEFTGERRRGKQKPRKGAGDMWVLLGKNENRYAFTIEAKVTWPEQMKNPALWIARVNKKLEKATNQLKSLTKDYHYGRPAAVCYVVPALPKKGNSGRNADFSRAMKQFIKQMTADSPQTVVAAAWVKDLRKSPIDWWKKGRRRTCYLYPGVAIVIRHMKAWKFA